MTKYQWWAPGDVNAFFGLLLDNLANLVLTVGLLHSVFDFPVSFALNYMVPGTALGVVFGDLAFSFMAIRLARRKGDNPITAMPLGIDTPSVFGMVFFVLGPAFNTAKAGGLGEMAAAAEAWKIGICSIVVSGLFKLACAPICGIVRKAIPRAGLLGSLAAIALVLISFLPLLEILRFPVVGFVSLGVILTTLIAKIELPFRLPGALGAFLVGGALHYLLVWTGQLNVVGESLGENGVSLPTGWLEALTFGWTDALGASLRYLPVVLPFALATVVGGIDCTESASAAGDEYSTPQVIAVEACATLLAGCCGGVIQTTPYIGHPAYKAMGGRAAYTLAVAVFIGAAGLFGFFGGLYALIPKAAIFPILIFIGLEITAQSFHATPARHYAAVALACVPALAYLAMLHADQLLGLFAGGSLSEVAQKPGGEELARNLRTLRLLAAGFVVTSLIWSSGLAALIDRKLRRAAAYFGAGAVCALFGVIHSPLPGSPLLLPWNLPPDVAREFGNQTPYGVAAGYASLAVLLLAWELHRKFHGVESASSA